MSTPRSQASPPPTELVTLPSGYDRYLWGLPEDDLVYFRDRENVAAVLGSLSDRDLAAEAMLPRSGLAWMNTAALGPTTESGSDRSRWLFRCYGFEPALHRASMDYLVAQGGCPRLAVIYERGTPPLAVLWGRGYAKHRQWPEMLEIVLPDGATLAPSVASLAALRDANVCGVLLYVNNTRTASVVRAVRESGVDQPVMVWNARRSHDGFPEDETSLGPLILPVSAREADTASARRTQLSPPGDARPIDRLKHFVKEYTARGRREPPDEKAWRSFHAADHLFHAIGIAGADREAARSTLTAMRESPFGEEHYERLHGQPQCLFARFEDGRWHLETWPSVDDTTARLRQHEHGE